jgi:hypothetical protein
VPASAPRNDRHKVSCDGEIEREGESGYLFDSALRWAI